MNIVIYNILGLTFCEVRVLKLKTGNENQRATTFNSAKNISRPTGKLLAIDNRTVPALTKKRPPQTNNTMPTVDGMFFYAF